MQASPTMGQLKKNITTQLKLLTKNCARGAIKKIEQVLSTLQVLCLTFKTILAQAIAHQKNHAQPKGEKKFLTPSPLKKINGRSLNA